jgi:hypothetical protein
MKRRQRRSGSLCRDVSDRRDLIRYATLAANSHNTQPWKFRIGAREIDVLRPQPQTPVVDPTITTSSAPSAAPPRIWSSRQRRAGSKAA